MKSFLILVLALVSFATMASVDPYFMIDDEGKNVQIVESEEIYDYNYKSLPIGEIILKTKELLVLGKKIYDIVDKNKGIAETSFVPVSVLPKVEGADAPDLESMENWQGAKVVRSNFKLKNVLRMKVVEMDYKIHFYYGGSYNGKGSYIKGLTVIPVYLKVMPGFKFSASIETLGVVNSGTKESPVPVLTLIMKMKLDAPGQTKIYTEMFQVVGNGTLKQI